MTKVSIRSTELYPYLYIDRDDDDNPVAGNVDIPDDVIAVIEAARRLDTAVHVLLCRYERAGDKDA